MRKIINELRQSGHTIFTITDNEIWYIEKKSKELKCLLRPPMFIKTSY